MIKTPSTLLSPEALCFDPLKLIRQQVIFISYRYFMNRLFIRVSFETLHILNDTVSTYAYSLQTSVADPIQVGSRYFWSDPGIRDGSGSCDTLLTFLGLASLWNSLNTKMYYLNKLVKICIRHLRSLRSAALLQNLLSCYCKNVKRWRRS
jgi:hypothetical protein